MKLKIFLTLTGILFVALLSMIIVMSFISRRFIIQSEISQAKIAARAMAERFVSTDVAMNLNKNDKEAEKFLTLLGENFCYGICVLNQDRKIIYAYGKDQGLLDQLAYIIFLS